jgi:hypothetical protein
MFRLRPLKTTSGARIPPPLAPPGGKQTTSAAKAPQKSNTNSEFFNTIGHKRLSTGCARGASYATERAGLWVTARS